MFYAHVDLRTIRPGCAGGLRELCKRAEAEPQARGLCMQRRSSTELCRKRFRGGVKNSFLWSSPKFEGFPGNLEIPRNTRLGCSEKIDFVLT